ncbi:MAG: hypothetical protein HKM07_03600, partial [Chlamydiae bacterium]|nr:hypothetical protein [Chlamydiota bacterium]
IMTNDIPLRPIQGVRQPRVFGPPLPEKEQNISIETLTSIGKQLVEDSKPLQVRRIDLPTITDSPATDGTDPERVRRTWETKVKALSTQKLSRKEHTYVDTASKALFLQWEAEERKGRFLEIVEAKLNNSFQVTQQNSADDAEFECMISEIYTYAQLHGKIGTDSKIMELIFPTYSYEERKQIIDYMYQSREAPNPTKTKEALQTFASSPSSFKLVIVVKNNQKYIEAQGTTFFERVFHFLFDVKTTNWKEVLPFLNESKVKLDELDSLQAQLKTHEQRYDSLMKTPLDPPSMDNVDADLLLALDQKKELVRLFDNGKRAKVEITDATQIIQSIIQEKRAIEALNEKIKKVGTDSNIFVIDSNQNSEKQIVAILTRNFHT